MWTYVSRQQLAKIDTKIMTIGEDSIASSTSAKNLGVTFDSDSDSRLLQQYLLRCHRRCREKTAIRRQRCSQVDLEQEEVQPYHPSAEGSAPLASHPSAHRLQDRGIRSSTIRRTSLSERSMALLRSDLRHTSASTCNPVREVVWNARAQFLRSDETHIFRGTPDLVKWSLTNQDIHVPKIALDPNA